VSPGEQLEGLLGTSSSDVLLVSPFIKVEALKRTLLRLPHSSSLTVVTRWRVDELAQGVTDLAVWPTLRSRPKTKLLLCQTVHAKYYRSDDLALLGSANLTLGGMGWIPDWSIELLQLVAVDDRLRAFEIFLRDSSVRVSDLLYDATLALLKHIPIQCDKGVADGNFDLSEPGPDWIPTTRYPEVLFYAYNGQDDRLTKAAKESAGEDLRSLRLPPNLDKAPFYAAVGLALAKHALTQKVDLLVAQPQRFGHIRSALSSDELVVRSRRDPSEVWQTLMRWLLHFLPSRYICWTANYSEIFGLRINHPDN
jgi:hypothetical protein